MALLEFIYTGKINCRLDALTLQALFLSKFTTKKLVETTVMINFLILVLIVMSTYDTGELQLSLKDCLVNKTSEETALTNINQLGE